MDTNQRIQNAITHVFKSSHLSRKILRVYFTYANKVLTYNVITSDDLTEDELEDLYVTQTELWTHIESEVEIAENNGFVVNQIKLSDYSEQENYGILVYIWEEVVSGK